MRPIQSIILLLVAPIAHAESVTVLPETVTSVVLSNRDVNRIVCEAGDINDNFFSEEKGAIVTNEGANSFIKFRQRHEGLAEPDYVSARNEFYIVCAGAVYTLMVSPRDVPGKTVRLAQGRTAAINNNLALLGPLAEEDRAVELTLKVLKDDIPEGFVVTPAPSNAWTEGIIANAAIRKARSVRVDGLGLSLTEYWLKADTETVFDEAQALQPYFGDSVFSASVFPLRVRAGQIARLFVVTREQP